MANGTGSSITKDIKPTVPIILIKMSWGSTMLRSLVLSKSSFEIRFAVDRSTPYGNKCFEVTRGNPSSTDLGESWVPSLTSIIDERLTGSPVRPSARLS